MKNIDKFNPQTNAFSLIQAHSDCANPNNEGITDIDSSKRHALLTISFIEEIFNNFEGSFGEKMKLILEIKSEIPKFHSK